MKTLKKHQVRILLGRNDGGNIYLSAPSWDCGWYWGFGYIGNKNCHYHLDGLMDGNNLYDGLKEHFGDTLTIRESQIWTFCELVKTFYILKATAEVLGRGGAHYTTNPCKDVIMNKEEVERINSKVLPHIFNEIYKLLEDNSNNEGLFSELVTLNLEGNTMSVVEYMKENNIKTDDLKQIAGLTDDDRTVIHTYYWRDYHKNKK